MFFFLGGGLNVARVDVPNSKQKQASAPTDAPVPALGFSNEQLRRLSEAVVSSIQSRITVPLTSPQPKRKPFKSKPGVSFSDMVNVEHVTTCNRHAGHC